MIDKSKFFEYNFPILKTKNLKIKKLISMYKRSPNPIILKEILNSGELNDDFLIEILQFNFNDSYLDIAKSSKVTPKVLFHIFFSFFERAEKRISDDGAGTIYLRNANKWNNVEFIIDSPAASKDLINKILNYSLLNKACYITQGLLEKIINSKFLDLEILNSIFYIMANKNYSNDFIFDLDIIFLAINSANIDSDMLGLIAKKIVRKTNINYKLLVIEILNSSKITPDIIETLIENNGKSIYKNSDLVKDAALKNEAISLEFTKILYQNALDFLIYYTSKRQLNKLKLYIKLMIYKQIEMQSQESELPQINFEEEYIKHLNLLLNINFSKIKQLTIFDIKREITMVQKNSNNEDLILRR